MNFRPWLLEALLLFSVAAISQPVYSSDDLVIHQVSESVYRHETFLETEQYGKVSCNGMLVISEGKSAVFDTPSDDEASLELIKWLQDSMNTTIEAVIINHHHIDCLGGLNAFHELGISSFSSAITARLATNGEYEIPRNTFERKKVLKIGASKIHNFYPGSAHAHGNIVSYVEGEKVLFGGCMVKSLKAGKGNLNDANTAAWSATIRNIQTEFQDIQIVIPGHGQPGNTDLLDYTIEMFRE